MHFGPPDSNRQRVGRSPGSLRRGAAGCARRHDFGGHEGALSQGACFCGSLQILVFAAFSPSLSLPSSTASHVDPNHTAAHAKMSALFEQSLSQVRQQRAEEAAWRARDERAADGAASRPNVVHVGGVGPRSHADSEELTSKQKALLSKFFDASSNRSG